MTSILSEPRFYVYVLLRPNGEPFYVGKGQKFRIGEHETEAKSGHMCHKCNTIRAIWEMGETITKVIVFRCDQESEAFEQEIKIIAEYRALGYRLTNLTNGGEGTSGRIIDDQHWTQLHPEWFARGDKHGSKTHPERIARGDQSGARLHPERLARGDRHGSKTHPERVARGSAVWAKHNPVRGEDVHAAKLTEAAVRKIRDLAVGGMTYHEIAQRFPVGENTISRIVRRLIWKHVE